MREFESLSVDFGKLKLNGASVSVVPITTELGITGAVLIGSGTYSYAPEAGKEFKGHFHSAMLRFNPKDADAVIKMSPARRSSIVALQNSRKRYWVKYSATAITPATKL